MPKFFVFFSVRTQIRNSPQTSKKLHCSTEGSSKSSSWLPVLEISVFIDQVTETDVIKIVFVTQNDVELFLDDQELARAHQAS